MSQPIDGEELYLYLSGLATTVKAALVRTYGDDKQKPVYFVSKMLTAEETRYTDFERIALAFRMASNKLSSYFQAHTIIVLTSYPISDQSYTPQTKCFGTTPKMGIELSEFDIEYRTRSIIKGWVLANFIIEMSKVQP